MSVGVLDKIGWHILLQTCSTIHKFGCTGFVWNFNLYFSWLQVILNLSNLIVISRFIEGLAF